MTDRPFYPPQRFEPWPELDPYGPTREGGAGVAVAVGQLTGANYSPLPVDPGMIANIVQAIIRAPHQYAKPRVTQFAVPTASVMKLADEATNDSPRNLLIIANVDTVNTIYIGYDSNVTSASFSLSLSPGGVALFDAVVPQNDLFAISAGANATATVNLSVSTISFGF